MSRSVMAMLTGMFISVLVGLAETCISVIYEAGCIHGDSV